MLFVSNESLGMKSYISECEKKIVHIIYLMELNEIAIQTQVMEII